MATCHRRGCMIIQAVYPVENSAHDIKVIFGLCLFPRWEEDDRSRQQCAVERRHASAAISTSVVREGSHAPDRTCLESGDDHTGGAPPRRPERYGRHSRPDGGSPRCESRRDRLRPRECAPGARSLSFSSLRCSVERAQLDSCGAESEDSGQRSSATSLQVVVPTQDSVCAPTART